MKTPPKQRRSLCPPAEACPLPQRPSPSPRRELVLLAVIVLLAAACGSWLRFARSAVEHFDEGVYASNIYFGAPDFAYPQQRFYAPPLLPALIEAGMLAGLPPNVAALSAGFSRRLRDDCCPVVVRAKLVRPGGRSGRGDAGGSLRFSHRLQRDGARPTCSWACGSYSPSMRLPARSLAEDFRWAIGAGLYTGLAWWTKYNGWLPLAIEAAALPLLWLVTQQSDGPQARLLRGHGSDRSRCVVAVLHLAAIQRRLWPDLQRIMPSMSSVSPAGLTPRAGRSPHSTLCRVCSVLLR